jgi:hypothetical protein
VVRTGEGPVPHKPITVSLLVLLLGSRRQYAVGSQIH